MKKFDMAVGFVIISLFLGTLILSPKRDTLTVILKGDYPALGLATVRVYAYDKRMADREAVLLSRGDYPVTDNPMKININLSPQMKKKISHIEEEYLEYYAVPLIATSNQSYMPDFTLEGIPEVVSGRSSVIDMEVVEV